MPASGSCAVVFICPRTLVRPRGDDTDRNRGNAKAQGLTGTKRSFCRLNRVNCTDERYLRSVREKIVNRLRLILHSGLASLAVCVAAASAAAQGREAFLARQTIHCAGCNLGGAKLDRRDLTGADLSGADLTFADLWEARLTNASLRKATLTDANLHAATLLRADMSGVVGERTVLTQANMRGAKLSDAVLQEADLFQADLVEADLSR